MREILFRAKRKNGKGEWLYGDLLHDYWVQGDTFIPCAIRYKINGLYSFPIEVIPETVGQFTGLKDDCNNKIFEGDILTYNTMRFVVVFHEYSFRMKRMNGKGVIIPLPPTDRFFTIIGNIHDNPELSLTPEKP